MDQLQGHDPANLVQELNQQKIAYEKLWKENQQLERAEKTARSDLDHARDTIGSRDKQIAFLEAHIANLVQSIGQLAIKPGEEEAKKKGWSWRFWK